MQHDTDHEIIIVVVSLYYEVVHIDMTGQQYKMIIYGEIMVQ